MRIAADVLRAPRASAEHREVGDGDLKRQIDVSTPNHGGYGARNVWLALDREGTAVARCRVEQLMAELGLTGEVRCKVKPTTVPDPAAVRPPGTMRTNCSARSSRFARSADRRRQSPRRSRRRSK
ncbi:IS3 family transposase [Mycobacterium sp. IDR2000157661]|uniref:IS3 family transposase n=1 Tax=Mycobacterium sp. IDR2000157661 TaxID=2867005 RepID=UPI00351DA11B|nr:IS3 family transposase [Mycobacterium sp. IDR2000157661]